MPNISKRNPLVSMKGNINVDTWSKVENNNEYLLVNTIQNFNYCPLNNTEFVKQKMKEK